MIMPSSAILTPALSVAYLVLAQSRFTPALTPSLHARRVAAAPRVAKLSGKSDSELFMRQIGVLDLSTAVLIALPWTRKLGALVSVLLNAIGLKHVFWSGEDVGMPTWVVVGLFFASTVLLVL
jgi:hypothetical protein